jgi:hypothetical protein
MLGAAMGAPDVASATVYKWVDENGMTHYTTDPERVPRHLRGRWREPVEGVKSVDTPPAIREDELYSIPPPAPHREWPRDDDQIGAMPAVETAPAMVPPQEPTSTDEPIAKSPPALAPVSEPITSVTTTPGSSPTLTAAAPAGPAPVPPAAMDDSRIAELEDEIAQDREILKELLTTNGDNGDWLHDPKLREVAERLARLQRELNAARTPEGL